jgi:hypothetical protein
MKSQKDADRDYRESQRKLGNVRKTVMVPLDRWEELRGIIAKMRKEQIQKTPEGRL